MRYFIAAFLCFFALNATAQNLPPVEDKAKAAMPAAAFQPAPPEAAAPAKAAAPKPAGGLFGGKGGDDSIDITADKSLEWHEAERMYIASGHAKAKKGDVTVEADVLKAFDRKKADGSSEIWKLTAEGNVRVLGKTQTATGDAAEYDIDTRKATLTGKNLTFKTATDNVTARDSLEFWELENKAVAKGDAVEIRDGRRVRADELTALFRKSDKGDLVSDSMTAKGHVQITTEKDYVVCDEAIYYVTPNTATLSGNVFITQGKNQLKGDRAEADFKTGVSRILNTGTGRVHALIISTKGQAMPGASGSTSGKPAKKPQDKVRKLP